MLSAVILLPMLVTGCGKKGQDGEKKTVQKSEDVFLDNDAKPDERQYLRRASLRGQIQTELSPQELEKVAATEGITVEELKKSEDFDPYFNLKIVLVDEGGQLKIAYFEFMPPSMLD